MLLQDAEKLAKDLMNQHGLHYWNFKFDNAKRRLGLCSYSNRTISLSKHLTLLNELPRVKNTILHEIAHALVGCNNGHNWIWRQKAIEIGCDGNRCANVKTTDLVRTKGNYTAICTTCGTEHRRFKAPKHQCSCGECSNRFDAKYILNWEKVVK
jgi:predicted SprT family Zn-dependent metalloprotease